MDCKKVRVQARKCATCIFRPGNVMHLTPGRVKGMVASARRRDTAIICHERPGRPFGGRGAVCFGFFERFRTTPLQIAERLGMVDFVTPKTAPGRKIDRVRPRRTAGLDVAGR